MSEQGRKFNAIAYLRISKEDGDKRESDSISNQRQLIQNFIETENEIILFDEITDDGYSGVTFERPGFIKLMQEVYEGRANCIIVKDLSRFGRNHIEVGRYLEMLFPQIGIRFIAINDCEIIELKLWLIF